MSGTSRLPQPQKLDELLRESCDIREAFALIEQRAASDREVAERYRKLAERASDIIFETDREGRIALFNPTVLQILKYPPEAIRGRHYLSLIRPDRRAAAERFYNRQFLRRQPNTYAEWPLVSCDGREVWLGQNVQLIIEGSEVAGFQAVARDITDRHLAEEALRESQRELERRVVDRTAALQAINESLAREAAERRRIEESIRKQEAIYHEAIGIAQGVVYQLDFRSGAYTFLDEGIERLIGYTAAEMNLETWGTMYVQGQWRGPEPGLTIRDAIPKYRSGEISSWRADYQCRTRHGDLRWLSDASVPIRDESGEITGCLGILQDITERKALEDQLLQAMKMESVGRLAGGIAHDFNNILTVVMGYAELARAKLAPEHPASAELATVLKAADRAAELVSQLLAFARKQILTPTVLNLNALLDEANDLLRRLVREDIELQISLQPDLWHVRADRGQIEQVLFNLAANARDAMPDRGRLRIETRNVVIDEAYARRHLDEQPGEYVALTVSDTGTGMAPEVQARLFEPFYTTKELGKGTGLGLATCYGIVKQNQGCIEVRSEEGRGSSFRVLLPRTEGDVSPTQRLKPITAPLGTETILLVEDETAVRRVAARALRELGYTVLEASDGRAALEMARDHSKTIHILVTDVVMPEMGGGDLAGRLQAGRPDLRVLYISGYADNATSIGSVFQAGVAFLQKPFAPLTLAREVRRILDDAGETSSPPAD